ncbi:MAG TPA: tRNA pseudouridine(38-40) synthase TruA [Bacteroidetes bacterium]|jgi:tRNA pseudouridine38-40 synthase|nr:tRNA pseudouridine(38-40) synthase TruA [Bacteroidota bacterium]
MARFKVLIEYDGTRYSGWQLQKNARTVQGEIVLGIRKLFKVDDFEFHGSGRTDAGVHALAQVAHLDVKTMLAPEIIRMKLNDELPADINLLEVEKAPEDFHARHNAVARSYLYQISRRRTAFGKRFAWWIKDELNVELMNEASQLFVGMKDLQSFTDEDPEEKSTKVLIEAVEMREEGDLILLRVRGSHFIWKLVRRIVGTLAEVGRGKFASGDVEQFIRQKSDTPARYTAPPSGLFLERVFYKKDQLNQPLRATFLVDTFVRRNRHRP